MEKRYKKILASLALGGSLVISALPAELVNMPGYVPQAEAAASYSFNTNKTAVSQLEDIFTTVDLMDASIAELQAEMQAGHLTSEQLTQMYIDRIKAYDENKKLNSVISINPNALSDARALDKKRKAKKDMGKLYGIPIIVKDNYDVQGMATAAGAIALSTNIADEDSFTVKKLRDAGAVIIAKANLSEFATSAVDSHSTLGGDVHNPYDITRTPGGSSGGTAVAVTCNFAAAGLGTDTGGSIRNPSSFNNLYGIRPSKGLTSIQGVIPLMAQRDTTGPIARNAEDMAVVLEAMAGTDPKDDFTVEANADSLLGAGYSGISVADGLKGKRIGYLSSSFYHMADTPQEQTTDDGNSADEAGEQGQEQSSNPLDVQDEKITQMVKKTKSNLAKAGARFVDMSEMLPNTDIMSMSFGACDDTSEYDMNRYLHEHPASPYATLKDLLLSQLLPDADVNYISKYMGIDQEMMDYLANTFEETNNPYTESINGFMRAPYWKVTLRSREELSRIMKENNIDAVVYLGFFNVSAHENSETSKEYGINGSGYTYTFGPALGLPEMSIPMGFGETSDGCATEMPLGMNVFADFGDERTLMEIAAAYGHQAGDFIRRQPALTPALEDEQLNAYLEALMDRAESIDYSDYNSRPAGKVQLMYNAYRKADMVDTRDAEAAYSAAMRLARAYDNVMSALQKSGRKKTANTISVRGKNVSKASVTFTVKKAASAKAATVFTVSRKGSGSITMKNSTAKSRRACLSFKSGKVTLKKKAPKGSYTFTITVGADNKYKKTTSKRVTIVVK